MQLEAGLSQAILWGVFHHRQLSYGLHGKQHPVFGVSDRSRVSEGADHKQNAALYCTAQAAECTGAPGPMHSSCKSEKYLNDGLFFFLFVLTSKFCVPCTLMAFDSNLTPLILNFPLRYRLLIYLSLTSVND